MTSQEEFQKFKVWVDDMNNLADEVGRVRSTVIRWKSCRRTGTIRKFVERGKFLVEDVPAISQ